MYINRFDILSAQSSIYVSFCAPYKITYKEVEKLDTPLIIDQSKISKDVKEFKAGASYNVYITIYGFEKIEVTAVLTAWEDGGDIETDIEDGK